MTLDDFRWRLPASLRLRIRERTLLIWQFAHGWIAKTGESDCFDYKAVAALRIQLGITVTKSGWVTQLRAMEHAGLLEGHRIVVSLEFRGWGSDFLSGARPGSYVAYTLPGMVALGKDDPFIVTDRKARSKAQSAKVFTGRRRTNVSKTLKATDRR